MIEPNRRVTSRPHYMQGFGSVLESGLFQPSSRLTCRAPRSSSPPAYARTTAASGPSGCCNHKQSVRNGLEITPAECLRAYLPNPALHLCCLTLRQQPLHLQRSQPLLVLSRTRIRSIRVGSRPFVHPHRRFVHGRHPTFLASNTTPRSSVFTLIYFQVVIGAGTGRAVLRRAMPHASASDGLLTVPPDQLQPVVEKQRVTIVCFVGTEAACNRKRSVKEVWKQQSSWRIACAVEVGQVLGVVCWPRVGTVSLKLTQCH